MPLPVGTKLGPYEILAPIGAGGMGEVYKARDTRLDRIVAIKQLKGQRSARFEQEARAIAALNHPHICQIHDVGPDYLVLEFVDGKPLTGPMTAADAVRLGLQIVSAMDAAHKRGILHRDLKPGNILVNESGAKLLDFGLAKSFTDGDATQTLGISGTPLYMSPEQAEGRDLDARSDVFSFGAVLYEMLAGRRAFDSLGAVLRDEPLALDTSPGLQGVVDRCLRKSPADRFSSAAEVRRALENAAVAKPAQAQPSIAVLPFANLSGDKEQEYFSDGLADEIISALVKIAGLKVIARTSAFAFKGQHIDIRKIAEALGVAHVLEGSVRRSGNRIRVTAQLIAAADGSPLWSERYDREMADVFAVQDEISAAITEALQLKLSPQAAKPRYTPKLPSYEALLKAKHFHWQVTAESMAQAKVYYEQAIELDPQFALAHASYADYLGGRTVIGLSSAHEVLPIARSLALTALKLDPTLPEAHALLGWVAAIYDYDWAEATRRYNLMQADRTPSPWCHMTLGWSLFLGTGRRTEAVREHELAFQADPLHLVNRVLLAMCLTADGRYSEAEEHLRQVIGLDRNFYWAHDMLSQLHAVRQMFDEALPYAETACAIAPWHFPSIGVLAGLLFRTGQPDRGEDMVQRLGTGGAYGSSVGLALCSLCRGDVDQAADWFEKAIEERHAFTLPFIQGPLAGPLRASPRWPKLAALVNLPMKAGRPGHSIF